jgi:hypothetical protein
MPQRTKPGVDWAEIQERFVSGETSHEIAQDFDVKRQSIDKRAKKEGWSSENRKGDSLDEEKIDWLAFALQTDTAKIHADPKTLSDKHIVALGRRSPQIMAKILEMVGEGASPNLAVQACGLSEGHVTNWKQQDTTFNELLRVARGTFLSGQQRNIARASDRGDWKAAQAILQSAPETRKEWASNAGSSGGITVNISIGGEDSPPIVDITPTEDVSD